MLDSALTAGGLRFPVSTPGPGRFTSFPPKSDEEPAVVGDEGGEEAEGDSEEGDQEETLRIDLEGLGERVMALPGVSPGSYQGIIPTEDGLLYFSNSSPEMPRPERVEIALLGAEFEAEGNRSGSWASGVEAQAGPFFLLPDELDAVVKAVRPALPELYGLGIQPVPAPKRWKGNLSTFELRLILLDPLL